MRRFSWARWRKLSATIATTAAVAIGGCGGGPPPAEAPALEPSPSQAPPATAPEAAPSPAAPADEAELYDGAVPAGGSAAPPPPTAIDALSEDDELAQAERELYAADRELSGAPPRSRASKSGEGASQQPARREVSTCATTCKAYASLLRARDAICRIDGDDGTRCARAREVVNKHTPKREACSCNE